MNQCPAPKDYSDDGWAETDNNIVENAILRVNLGRKNFGSSTLNMAKTALISLIRTCKLGDGEPESHFHYLLDIIADWPMNCAYELMLWSIVMPAQ